MAENEFFKKTFKAGGKTAQYCPFPMPQTIHDILGEFRTDALHAQRFSNVWMGNE